MRYDQGTIILSPSDLMRFQGCRHATALDLRYAQGGPLVPAEDGPDAALLQKKGHAHEEAYLDRLAAGDVVEIARTDDFAAAAAETVAAMRRGVPVIYQGALGFGPWQGWSDFIERVEEPSGLGPWSYEVVDTKLKRRADPKHALQLAIYSKAVAEIQGRQPDRAHVVIGSGERISIDLADVRHSVDRLAERLVAFIATPDETVPEPMPACGLCRWREHCDDHYAATDSLVRVAGITRQQRRRLQAAGITTLAGLASSAGRISGMAQETLDKLRTQARLQLGRRAGGPPALELKFLEPGRGFARLPRPSPGDLFFDMEGDPLIEGGREYLFGVFHEEHGSGRFHAWWAHDDDAEKAALEAVLSFFVERLAADRDAHIYHYAQYEVTALKRLTQRYGTGEAILDHLLRSQRFVDLYRVVQQGLQASEAGYSLKGSRGPSISASAMATSPPPATASSPTRAGWRLATRRSSTASNATTRSTAARPRAFATGSSPSGRRGRRGSNTRRRRRLRRNSSTRSVRRSGAGWTRRGRASATISPISSWNSDPSTGEPTSPRGGRISIGSDATPRSSSTISNASPASRRSARRTV